MGAPGKVEHNGLRPLRRDQPHRVHPRAFRGGLSIRPGPTIVRDQRQNPHTRVVLIDHFPLGGEALEDDERVKSVCNWSDLAFCCLSMRGARLSCQCRGECSDTGIQTSQSRRTRLGQHSPQICMLSEKRPSPGENRTYNPLKRRDLSSISFPKTLLLGRVQLRVFSHRDAPTVGFGFTAAANPRGKASGLPCSASVPEWGRSALFAGSQMATTGVCVARRPYCTPFGPSLSAPLAC
jgi:hypothetical protein